MLLAKRIGYYLVGVALGSLAVLYFWKQKNVTFDYGMDARTLKSIRTKKRVFSQEALQVLQKNTIDTSEVSNTLKYGDVSFKKSKPRLKPCAEYYITGKKIDLYVQRCDSTATIKEVIIVQ